MHLQRPTKLPTATALKFTSHNHNNSKFSKEKRVGRTRKRRVNSLFSAYREKKASSRIHTVVLQSSQPSSGVPEYSRNKSFSFSGLWILPPEKYEKNNACSRAVRAASVQNNTIVNNIHYTKTMDLYEWCLTIKWLFVYLSTEKFKCVKKTWDRLK